MSVHYLVNSCWNYINMLVLLIPVFNDIIHIWGVSRKLATSVNQGDNILTMMDAFKCTQITLLKLNFSQYPSIHTNYIISHCTTS